MTLKGQEMTRILTKQHELNEAFNRHNNALNRIEERRNLWKNGVKNELVDALELIKASNPSALEIQQLSEHNLDTVNIGFKDAQSGIYDRTENLTGPTTMKSYHKIGGYLAFAQAVNGKVHVFMRSPHIDGITEPFDPTHVETIEPELLTETKITDYFIRFLEHITVWEGADSQGTIGFKLT